ncbi:MAG: signal peptidase II [Thermoleophilia bacterium]|nr:signal peptidase II [Thermoleophilia bacterium]
MERGIGRLAHHRGERVLTRPRILTFPRRSVVACAVTALMVLAVDLTTKAIAVNDPGFFGAGLIYNPERPHHVVRFGVCAVTLVVVSMISTYARSRGAGSVPAVWIAAGLLVGGVVGNWIAGAYWDAGVPDFISRGDRMWNLADFAIGMGMLLFLVSTLAYAIRAFAHDRKDRST